MPIKTGIYGFDEIIPDGDISNRVYIIAGSSGTGKDKSKGSPEHIGKKLLEKNVQKVFKDIHSIGDFVSQYGEKQLVYGIFVDFTGDIKGIFLIIIPEDDALRIVREYKGGIVDSLKEFGKVSGKEFKKKSSLNIKIKDVNIAYDNILSIINYLLSEVGENKSLLLLNVKFIFENTKKGDAIFVPKNNML